MTLPKVVVEEADVDAALIDNGPGQLPTLVLRPTLTFTSAVRAVRQVLPTLHPSQASQLVRKHLPNAYSDADSLLLPPIPTPAPMTLKQRHPRGVWLAAAGASLLLALGTWAVVDVSTDTKGDDSAAQMALFHAAPQMSEKAAERDRAGFIGTGGTCRPIGTATDLLWCEFPHLGGGRVEAYFGTEGIKYRLVFGDEVAVLHSFNATSNARAFMAESAAMYTHIEQDGPWVLAGSSAAMLGELRAVVQDAAAATHTSLDNNAP